ncbi:shikimate dehydrogenase [Sphaerotilus hippei]|uniref:Shikimate dehydrogenase (NADP(+)) n=1 Tax=Sphaerotilus hippei TaxID=744406 RepID=A0A318GX57_9BURK|nr:shikimate dehydrogenase [Sphaerotilus hippei]PXW94028.1 shikimate dehydrogenase [Sphaerotilus hippei]
MTDSTASNTPRKVLLGLIGQGIQKSLTPAMQEREAAQHGLRLHYQLIDLDVTGSTVEALPTLLQSARIMGYAGLNITYPCKQAVIPLLDELSEEARAMGAVNTVVLRDGRLIGHNTDGSGWTRGFTRALPDADLSRVVLLGAGGAGAAIAHAVVRLGAAQLTIVDNDADRAAALAAELNRLYGEHARSSTDIASAMADATGLIHATPTGMDKLPGLPLDAALLRPDLWVSEVVYFPLETALLKKARELGCPVSDGGGMAVGQAVGAFELFTGLAADASRVEAHFRDMVGERSQAGTAA